MEQLRNCYLGILIAIIGMLLITFAPHNTEKKELDEDGQMEERFKSDSLETLINLYMFDVVSEARKNGKCDYQSGATTPKGKTLDSLVRDLYRQKRELIQRE